MSKSPEMKSALKQLFPVQEQRKTQGLCPTCGKPVSKFRNSISEKEFGISGMCQVCQDSVFGAD